MLFVTHFSIMNTFFNYFLIMRIYMPSLTLPLRSHMGYYFISTLKMFRTVLH